MKILWYSSKLLPEVAAYFGLPADVKRGWVESLACLLTSYEAVDLAVATLIEGVPAGKYEINGITQYIINRDGIAIGYDDGRLPSQELLHRCLQAAEDFSPDLVHIHGTEYIYGLLASTHLLACPAVISIQGLVHVCARYYLGLMSPSEILRSNLSLEWMLGRSLLQEQRRWAKRGRLEQQVIENSQYFIGRTRWDRAHILALNPDARYYSCWEMIREPFYHTQWDATNARPHTIFCTSGSYPLKGFHWLLKAVSILRKEFPGISLRIADAMPGGKSAWKGYNRFLRGLIRQLNLVDTVVPLGRLTAEEVARELSQAHVFAIPSLIENSPNSLSEAMLVGTPCVASLSGGIPSLVEDGKTALCFPPGDEAVMAECIRTIFNDHDVAQQLSGKARIVARQRHDAEQIKANMIDIYADIIRQHNNVTPNVGR